VQPAHVGDEQQAHFVECEPRLRVGGDSCSHECDGILELVHRARCDGVESARLATDHDRRDDEYADNRCRKERECHQAHVTRPV